MRHSRWWAFAALMVAASASWAVRPSVWRIASAQEVEQGDVEGLSVGDDGTLALAPALDDLGETEELFVWALAEGRGGRIYAGTGNQGRVFVKEGDEPPRLVFDSPETEVQSLVVDGQGNVYAGCAPDGIIYRITPDGASSVFCHTGETYIWDLEFGRDGNLYAATGSMGVVLKIGTDGRVVDKVLDTRDRHVMVLVPDGRGGFYGGTDGSGLVYHIDAEGRPRLLFAAPEKEIHTLAVGPDGRVYAGAVAGRRDGPQGQGQGQDAEPGGVVYRIEPSGAATRLWQAPYPLILSIVPYDSTRMLVGVGPRGVLYWLSVDGRVQRVADTGESQPACMLRRANGDIIIGMGNSGKLKRLGQRPADHGVFTSDVHDANMVSQWGRADVRATGANAAALLIESRTGNSDDPAEAWSPWAALGGPDGGTVQSPPGRYIQLRATLTRSDASPQPRLHSLAVTGQQVNVRPEVNGVQIAPYRPGAAPSRPAGERSPSDDSADQTPARTAARAPVRRTIVLIRWNVSDGNNDDLVFDLYYRRIGETAWKLLDQDVARTSYMWDTEGVPEGLTVVKVVASDRPSNPWPTAQTDELVSSPIEIDYTGPAIEGLQATVRPDGAIHLEGTGRDAAGTIHAGSYSIDSGEWLAFFPADDIFDGPVERLDFVTEALEAGEHTIVVRLEDAAGNVGAASAVVRVPGQ